MTISAATDGDLFRAEDATVRESAVLAAMDLCSLHPLHEITLGMVAARIGVPEETVATEIGDLNDLVVAAIQYWNARRLRAIESGATDRGAIAFLRELLAVGIAEPACTRMVMTASSIAGTPDHPAALMLRTMWIRFHAVVQRALTHDIAVNREPDTMEPANGAEQLLAIYEGLQFQWLFRPHMDLLGSYDRAVTRLRRGWSEAYEGPIWNI